MASIFSQIANGKITAVKVHEDELTMAIMDINPIQTGQIVVFPKTEFATIWDMPVVNYRSLMEVVQKCGQQLRLVFPHKARIGVMVEGLEVRDHAHVKVFPFSTQEEFHSVPDVTKGPSTKELEVLASKLKF